VRGFHEHSELSTPAPMTYRILLHGIRELADDAGYEFDIDWEITNESIHGRRITDGCERAWERRVAQVTRSSTSSSSTTWSRS
jgi:hypothetical protein